ncbi:MAG: hypothetical protein D6802_04800 [Ardenticatenia bacterium]|nr:MAG: hypothetical protein D6802_04800 [Ardenticatenia bacterium]
MRVHRHAPREVVGAFPHIPFVGNAYPQVFLPGLSGLYISIRALLLVQRSWLRSARFVGFGVLD